MICAKCGGENLAGKRFCGDCGSPLANRCAKMQPTILPASGFGANMGHRSEQALLHHRQETVGSAKFNVSELPSSRAVHWRRHIRAVWRPRCPRRSSSALQAALRIQEKLHPLSATVVAGGGSPIHCRIRANTERSRVRSIATGEGHLSTPRSATRSIWPRECRQSRPSAQLQ